jgi:hypothetical protein
MNKLESHLQTPTFVMDNPSQSDSDPTRHLIVLFPADTDHTAAIRRLWELAINLGVPIQILGLCKDAIQEPGLRRELLTISSLLQHGGVSATLKIEIGTNWVDVVKRNYQEGDTIVCFAEQRAGLFHRPLSQMLQSNLKAPLYILSSLHPQSLPRPNWLSQIMAWAGSAGIIIASFLLQIRITALPQDWAQTTLMLFSVMGEIWLIWVWNSLLK